MTDHCNGCGVAGKIVSREPVFDRSGVEPAMALEWVSASTWPDSRARLLCVKCRGKLRTHVRRLEKANTGWGHLT
jgi:hypothetical protein